jgi:hypothetical protein
MLSKRTPAEICNRKAYMINRRAIWHTKKADAQKIQEELGAAEAFNLVINKAGKRKGMFSRARKHSTFVFANTVNDLAGRWERIVIARLRKAGKAIPKAEELAEYLAKAFKARLRSIAFIKSGFIEPRERFKAWCQSHGVPIGKAGLPAQEGPGIGGPKQIGPSKKGGAAPANFNWFTRATFFNSAVSRHSEHQDALTEFGGEALQRAFNEETADTLQEIEKRLRQHAQACGIKTN